MAALARRKRVGGAAARDPVDPVKARRNAMDGGAASCEVSLRQHAYASFTERLLARDIRPGEIVSQRQLMGLTGMPLGAIREMIPRLETDGLIRTVPKRGLQVLAIDLDLIREAFQLRRIVEGEAAARYAETAPDEEIAAAEAGHRAVREEAAGGATPALVERAQRVDWAFHDRLIDALDNRIIWDIHRVNAIKIRLIRNADTRMLPELVVAVMDEHLAVIDALRARDGAAATAAIQAHVDSAKRRALTV